MHNAWKSFRKKNRFFLLVVTLQSLLFGVVYLNIPIVRQVVGFAYLVFVPGAIILRVLRLDLLGITEKMLFCVGLSIAFLMFVGLLVNEFAPLTSRSLMLVINLVLLALCYFADSNSEIFFQGLKPRDFLAIVFCICLIASGLIGNFLAAYFQINSVLLFLVLVVSGLIVLIAFYKNTIPSRYYSLIIIAVSISLLFGLSGFFINQHIFGGGDEPLEFYAFKLTSICSHWNSSSVPSSDILVFPTYSMASVTILPTIFLQIAAIEETWLFKIFFNFILCFIPLCAYQLYKTQTDKKAALLATFLLVTISIGKGWGPSKQIIAQLFFILLFLVVFEKRISTSKKMLLLIIFSFALVVSHYSLSYIFMYIILLGWVFSVLLGNKSRKIRLSYIMFFLILTFSWYIFVTESSTFNSLINDIKFVYRNALTSFWSLEGRRSALEGLGVVNVTSATHRISTIFFYTHELLIGIGFIKLVLQRKKTTFDMEYVNISYSSMSIILFSIIIPSLADMLLMSRFYQTALIILAPLFVLGVETLVQTFSKLAVRKNLVLSMILMVLIPLFLFQTGFIYEITSSHSYSLPLSSHRWDSVSLYSSISHTTDVFGAQWLARYTSENILVYSDSISKFQVLPPYGMVGRERIFLLANTTKSIYGKTFIYLTHFNVVDGKVYTIPHVWNISEISSLLMNQSKVFSNGACEIYVGYRSGEM